MGRPHPRSGEAAAFGGELKRRRLASGLTQTALAERVGCEWSTLSRFESGRRKPSLPMAVRIAAVLSDDEGERCRLVLAAGFVPPGYAVTGLKRTRAA